MNNLTPKEIVAELDKFIIGQNQAKKMVAIAVRNRWRRQNLTLFYVKKSLLKILL